MDYQEAVNIYAQALVDIAAMLHTHHEGRTEFAPAFVSRAVQDGFLQAVSDVDRERVFARGGHEENFLLWNGVIPHNTLNWNAVSWIFPFHSADEMERAYELITRADLAHKSWAGLRQFWLTCRFKLQEAPLQIPTNFVKIRMKGAACAAAMRCLEPSPPNLRYLTRLVVDRLPASNYFRARTNIRIVVGERLEPSIRPLTQQSSLL
jgi:hypothetical protein